MEIFFLYALYYSLVFVFCYFGSLLFCFCSIIKFYCCHILCRHGKVTAINAFYAFSSLRIHDFNVFTTLIHVGFPQYQICSFFSLVMYSYFTLFMYICSYVCRNIFIHVCYSSNMYVYVCTWTFFMCLSLTIQHCRTNRYEINKLMLACVCNYPTNIFVIQENIRNFKNFHLLRNCLSVFNCYQNYVRLG